MRQAKLIEIWSWLWASKLPRRETNVINALLGLGAFVGGELCCDVQVQNIAAMARYSESETQSALNNLRIVGLIRHGKREFQKPIKRIVDLDLLESLSDGKLPKGWKFPSVRKAREVGRV